jgi:hypothetical protein
MKSVFRGMGAALAMLGAIAVPSKAIHTPQTAMEVIAEGLDPKNKPKPKPVKLGPDPCPDRLARADRKRERKGDKLAYWAGVYYETYYASSRLRWFA